MIYTDILTEFKGLEEIMRRRGVPESSIELCLQYMSDGDISVLEGIKPIKPTAYSPNYGYPRDVSLDDFEKQFSKKEGREKLLRYIEFCYSAAGFDSYELIYNAMYPRSVSKETACAEALQRRFGEEGRAMALAMKAYYICSVREWFDRLRPENAKLCLDALDIIDRRESGKDQAAAAVLCTYALALTPLSSEGEKTDERVLAAANRIVDLSRRMAKDPPTASLMTVGLAEACYFIEEAKPVLAEVLKDNILSAAEKLWDMGFINDDDNNMSDRVLDMFESFPECVTPEYIGYIAVGRHRKGRDERLARLAVSQPEKYREILLATINSKPFIAVEMAKIYEENTPGFNADRFDIKGRLRKRMADAVASGVKDDEGRKTVHAYIEGNADFSEMYKYVKNSVLADLGNDHTDYFSLYGADDHMKRAFTAAICSRSKDYWINERVYYITGFYPIKYYEGTEYIHHGEMSLDCMIECGAPIDIAISRLAFAIEGCYCDKDESRGLVARAALKYPELLEKCSTDNMEPEARLIYAKALACDPLRFKTRIAVLAEDGSKFVKQEVVGIYKEHKEFAEDIKSLLAAKKLAKRETAVTVLETWGSEGFEEQLQKALDSEKNDSLKLRIAALIGSESAAAAVKVSTEDMMKKLMKGASKVAWLYNMPFSSVHKKDGTIAEEDYLKAIMLCYAGMKKLARNPFACELAEVLDQAELAVFAKEVFDRWFDRGAEAKTKWVLYFCAVHGGSAMCRELVRHINEWGAYSFNMRTAIAGEAVKALAMNGSSEALMTVDNISRKFKSRSVRVAANDAMAAAADGIGITAEELADRIVPDLGFDDKLCRIFDYGSRQFEVYIRPSLELEIMSGGKLIKSMPKPSASDDAEKANAAYESFKEMKKVMKAAVTLQRQRLEYVLMCDRRWRTDGWLALFVKNAVMHCFAIGLIWGIYEGTELKSTFRYMEDGSFTTVEGDEFTLPDKAEIGLVHPLELTDEQRAAWKEQLDDFEIVQPFPQLSRKIFTPDKKELEARRNERFKGCELNSLSLVGKMTRLGWYKGKAEDAGCFYYFIREDVSSRSLDRSGNVKVAGCGALLVHSGTYIETYHTEGEDIKIEDIVFFKAGAAPDYWSSEEKGCLKGSEVPPRYFSEIVLQLTSVFGNREA